MTREIIKKSLVLIGLIFVAVWVILPVYWMISTSLQNPLLFKSNIPHFIFQPTLRNYVHLLTKTGFPLSFLNSLVVALGHTILVMGISILAAYALSRFKIKRSKFIQFWIVLTRSLPPIGMAVPFYLIYINMGIMGSRFGLIVLYLTLNLSFSVMMLRGYIDGIPSELDESGFIDGATRLQVVTRIIMPVIIPGIVATSIFVFTIAWNEYVFAFLFTEAQSATAPVIIASFMTPMGIQWGLMSAAGSLIITPVIVFSLLTKKYLIAGLTMGALKE